MKFIVEIDCGNEAFGDQPEIEIVKILEAKIMPALNDYSLDHCDYPPKSLTLRDLNGNTVGVARFDNA